jgi:GH25 family lysozyme M1 (1,4-beta-N-acetylmuramidase)
MAKRTVAFENEVPLNRMGSAVYPSGPNSLLRTISAVLYSQPVFRARRRMINVVVDISHHNGGQINFNKVKDGGILGVIHKATQGQSGRDPNYRINRARAKNAGLWWGAYHFGTGGDGIKQAQNFLDAVGDTSDTLLVLDFESNRTGPSMDLIEARAFVSHIAAETGRHPGFYSGHYIKSLLGSQSDSILAQCWFWLAQYGPTPVAPRNWETWTLWQYTDGAFGSEPHTVAGVGRCDRNRFNGDVAQLVKLWFGEKERPAEA